MSASATTFPDSQVSSTSEEVSGTEDGSQYTQPTTQSVGAAELGGSGEVWACLVQRSEYFRTVSVVKNTFSCGTQDCDYLLTDELIPSDCFRQYSRRHFVLEKESDGNDADKFFDVFISDLSMNGTFVNGEKIGKGKKRPLVHNDVIALTSESREAFQFVLVHHEPGNRAPMSLPSSPLGYGGISGRDGKFPAEFLAKYIVGRLIGKGSAGKVYLGYTKACPRFTKVAIKVISKSNLSKSSNNNAALNNDFCSNRSQKTLAISDGGIDNFRQEVDILRRLSGHPCIIRFEDFYESWSSLVIVMELAAGGELFDYVLTDFNDKSFEERTAKLQFYQILSGVKYLHANQVCHRDIKLENILLSERKKTSLIKITDFGLSKLLDENTVMSSYVGTPTYIAPEVLRNAGDDPNARQGVYTVKADIWSLGCIMFSILCGSPAFHGNNDTDLRNNIMRGKMNSTTSEAWNTISPEAKSLLGKLLMVNPRQRISADEALNHPWFVKDPTVVQEAEALMNCGMMSISREVGNMGITNGVSPLKPVHLPPGKRCWGGDMGTETETRAPKRRITKDDAPATS